MGKVVFVNSDRIGDGEAELGLKLMQSFLYSLARTDAKPSAVLFMNSGVRLTFDGSAALDDIKLLAEGGVESSRAARAWTTTAHRHPCRR